MEKQRAREQAPRRALEIPWRQGPAEFLSAQRRMPDRKLARRMRELIVRHDANNKNGLAGFDFVAGGKHRFLNLRAIQMGAVGAFLVNDAAAAGAAFHREVHARHVIVVGNGKLRPALRAANGCGLPTHDSELFSGQRPVLYFQNDAQNRILTN